MTPDPGASWRLLGPHRGGRVVAVAGHSDEPDTYYFGGAAGGVWKTTDAGWSWQPLTDGWLRRAAIGALAVAPSDSNVVMAGTGEACTRADVSHGDGVYRSEDAGRTWRYCGLPESHHIGRLLIDPRNDRLLFCAALGHLYGENSERGVYRSRDGGETWDLVLRRDGATGAIDLCFDPSNPRTLFASLWQVRRSPWTLSSGGPGSGLFVSHDGGDSWTELSQRPGFPTGIKGRIGVAVAPGGRGRVWAIVESEVSGLYRSDDLGEHWMLVSDRPDLTLRPFYYMHVIAHPTDPETVHVMNMRAYRSVDSGRTFTTLSLDHGDEHGLWISSSDPRRMILGNDGGAVVSTDGGLTWSSRMNQPIAAFYTVVADSRRPYWLYGPQQDSTTYALPSRSPTGLVAYEDGYAVGGCESGWVAVTRSEPVVAYAGGYDGTATRYEVDSRRLADISVWPEDRIGSTAGDVRFRFNWSTPVITSRFDRSRVYCAAQFVFQSDDEGQTWRAISPDLTRGEPQTLGPSGGPLTLDNYTAEYYACIVVLAEDPSDADVLWTGSDDGRIHVTQNGGLKWSDVTPRDLPDWAKITCIEIGPAPASTVFVSATRERIDDERPYLFTSNDRGQSWTSIGAGLGELAVCRSVRCDPDETDVLYVATDEGVAGSFDRGATWEPLQFNLPSCPVYDLTIAEHDLVAATHGRSLWILENLPAVRWAHRVGRDDTGHPTLGPLAEVVRLTDIAVHLEATGETNHVYVAVGDFVKARAIVRSAADGRSDLTYVDAGVRRPNDVMIRYHLPRAVDSGVRICVRRQDGVLIREFAEDTGTLPAGASLSGFHSASWDLRYPPAEPLEPERVWFMFGNYMWGPVVAPGRYSVELSAADSVVSTTLDVTVPTDRIGEEAIIREHVRFLLEVRDRLSHAHESAALLRALKADLGRIGSHAATDAERTAAERLRSNAESLEGQLVPLDVIGPGDYHRHPSALNGRLMGLAFRVGESDGPVTVAQRGVLAEVGERQDELISRITDLNAQAAAILRDAAPAGPQNLVRTVPGFRFASVWRGSA